MNASTRLQIAAVALIAVIAVAAATVALVQLRQGQPQPGTFTGPLTAAASVTPERQTLTVVGQGMGQAAPDTARVSLGVAPVRPNVHDASSVAADEQNKLVAALRGQGVEDKDIQTESMYISQNHNCCPDSITGYTATMNTSVIVHHLTNVGTVVGAAADAVGNDIRMNGINLSVSDSTAALKAARTAALADAAVRAGDWATNSKHHIGKIVAISEITTTNPQPFAGCQGGCGGGGFPISAGQTTLNVAITVVYELQD